MLIFIITFLNRFDLSIVPKELLYHDVNSYNLKQRNNISALETLEQAHIENKKVLNSPKEENFWSKVGNIFNPFKCGKNQ